MADHSPLHGRQIVLDPGHGGETTGTTECPTLFEKAANLQIARLLRDMLEADGASVTLTRTTDDENPSNRERAAFANNKDVLISIHLNGVSNHPVDRVYCGQGIGAPLSSRLLTPSIPEMRACAGRST